MSNLIAERSLEIKGLEQHLKDLQEEIAYVCRSKQRYDEEKKRAFKEIHKLESKVESIISQVSQVKADDLEDITRQTEMTATDEEERQFESKTTEKKMIPERTEPAYNFFQLSPSFPLTLLPPSACQFLSEHIRFKPPPNTSSSYPIPGQSLFVLSSLSPIPQVVNSKASKKLKAGKAKKKVNLPNFEKKVMKSKMITANLPKQRIRNMERFKTLIREVDGVFKCSCCGQATGQRSRAWSRATRCGLKRKNAPRKIKPKTCADCKSHLDQKGS